MNEEGKRVSSMDRRPVAHSDIAVRPRDLADDVQLAAIANTVNEHSPDLSPAELAALMTSTPAGVNHAEFVAENSGAIVGYGWTIAMFWTAEPGLYRIDIGVHPDRRGQGAGAALYERILATLGGWDARRLSADVRQDRPEGRRFAAARGFVETDNVVHLSRLDVRQANLAGYQGLPDRLAAEGVRVTTLAELGPDDEQLLRAVHTLEMEAGRDEPSADVFSLSFEHWRESLLNQPGVSPETVWVALAGDVPVGATLLSRQGTESGTHFGMGVDRAHRGRGIARLLKLRQIEWAREHGIHYLYTANHRRNPRMYDINLRLGYEALPAILNVSKELTG